MPAAADVVVKLRFVQFLSFMVVDRSRGALDQADLCKAVDIGNTVDQRAADKPVVVIFSSLFVEYGCRPIVDLVVEQHFARWLRFDGSLIVVRQLDAPYRLRRACKLARSR